MCDGEKEILIQHLIDFDGKESPVAGIPLDEEGEVCICQCVRAQERASVSV